METSLFAVVVRRDDRVFVRGVGPIVGSAIDSKGIEAVWGGVSGTDVGLGLGGSDWSEKNDVFENWHNGVYERRPLSILVSPLSKNPAAP